jgi:hypothetical protein
MQSVDRWSFTEAQLSASGLMALLPTYFSSTPNG